MEDGALVMQNLPFQLVFSAAVCLGVHQLRFAVTSPAKEWARALGAPTEERRTKFAMQLVNLVFHTLSGLYLGYAIFVEGWLEDPNKVWDSYATQHHASQYLALYCFECGYHLQRLIGLLVKTRREDFWEMFIHHTVTIFLMFISLAAGWIRIGMLVLFVHDVSDVLGCFVKMVNACNMKILSVIVFFPMAACWAYLRCYLLPFYIVPIAAQVPNYPAFKYPSLACLGILITLHVYWCLFMTMLAVAIMSKGRVGWQLHLTFTICRQLLARRVRVRACR